MLLLGVLQAQAAGVTPLVTDFDLLDEEILLSDTSSISFSSLAATYSADYQHLQVRMVVRNTSASTASHETYLRFNSDTGSNYNWHRLSGNGSTVTSASGSGTYIRAGENTRNGNTAGMFSATVIDILDPFETTKNTTVRVLTGVAGTGNQIGLFSGLWRNTNALTDLYLAPEANSWITGSRFSLYGIKAGA